MAPGRVELSEAQRAPSATKHLASNGSATASTVEDAFSIDPSVMVSQDAPAKTKELWWLHGHPHSERYSNPSLNSIGALVRHQGLVSAGRPAYLYPMSTSAESPYKIMTWDDFDAVTEAVAAQYGHSLDGILRNANTRAKQPTVALLGLGMTLPYFVTQIALAKLGVRTLLLAASNSQAITDDLLDRCEASALITDVRHVVKPAKAIPVLAMVEDLESVERNVKIAEVEAMAFNDGKDPWTRQMYIIHSSGSTGPPKPIKHTNRSMLLIARMYRIFPDFHVENWYLLFPLYHIAGISVMFAGLPNGLVTSLPPLSWPPSSSSILTSWKTLEKMGYPVDCLHCAPVLIENLHEHILSTTGDFSPLSDLKVLQPGGAKLSNKVVNDLVAHGVNVKTTYGSTEIGPPFRSIPHTANNPRCYSFRNLYPASSKIKMEEVGEGLYECIVYKDFDLAADLWEDKPDGEPYRTNDLFVQDPPGSGNFVLQGRRDDILIHSNGNNTAAGQLQMDLQEACGNMVAKLVLVGHSRPCVCLLVQVKDGIDPTSKDTLESIWAGVEIVNAKAPSHSRVLKSMIYILPSEKSLPITPKGNVKRSMTEQMFSQEIDHLYAQLEGSSSSTIPGTSLSSTDLAPKIRQIVSNLTGVPASTIKDTTHLYDLGIDSQLALSLRAQLSTAIAPISLGTVFENASVGRLVSHFSSKLQGASAPTDTTLPWITQTIEKLSSEVASWPQPPPNRPLADPSSRIVLLTGASGTLGTALLDVLGASPDISRIYALVRGPNAEAKTRAALEARGLDAERLLGSEGKVRVLEYSMRDPLLGLDAETYARLSKEVSVVMHNAWKMDFNMPVQDFEADCFRGTLYILRFAHATTHHSTFAFTSSISTHLGPSHPSHLPVPESPTINPDPATAQPTGYGQGKYILERLLSTLPCPTHTPTLILRVGQLCGDARTGTWSTREMFPIMFASGAALGALPELGDEARVDWLPVDIAARTIAECLLAPADDAVRVHNVVNPHAVPWSAFVRTLARVLPQTAGSPPLPTVPLPAWVDLLKSAAAEGKSLPGLKLLGFFEAMVETPEAPREFATEATRAVSEALCGVGPVSEGWVRGWVEGWRGVGFL